MGRFHGDWKDSRGNNSGPGTVGIGFRLYSGFYRLACGHVEREIKSPSVDSGSNCGNSCSALVAREMLHSPERNSRERIRSDNRCQMKPLRLLLSWVWLLSPISRGQVASG